MLYLVPDLLDPAVVHSELVEHNEAQLRKRPPAVPVDQRHWVIEAVEFVPVGLVVVAAEVAVKTPCATTPHNTLQNPIVGVPAAVARTVFGVAMLAEVQTVWLAIAARSHKGSEERAARSAEP